MPPTADRENYTRSTNPENTSEEGVSKFKGSNLASDIARIIRDTPTAKIFLLLAMLAYAVLAYSKQKVGVVSNDIVSFMIFSVFTVIIYYIITHLHTLLEIAREYSYDIKKLKAISKKEWFLWLSILILVLCVVLIILNANKIVYFLNNEFVNLYN